MITHRPHVFILDKDKHLQNSLCNLFNTQLLNTKLFSKASDFLDYYSVHMTGCLITEMELPDMDGLELQQRLIQHRYSLPIIFLTQQADLSDAVEAMKNGAYYFLEKPHNPQRLKELVCTALDLDQQNYKRRIDFIAIEARINNLTDRELEVLKLVVNSYSNKAIAQELGVSIKTVEFHRSHMMEKMHARSLVELLNLTSGILPANN